MKTSSATRRIEIDAPIDSVFALLADPVKSMGLMPTPGRVVIRDVATDPAGVITSWAWSERFRLLPFNLHAKVTRQEHIANRRIVEKHSTGPVCTYMFEPSENGTLLTYTIELSRRVALLTKVQAFLTTKGKGVESDMDEFLVAVKHQLEA